jgi:hypothetical protein
MTQNDRVPGGVAKCLLREYGYHDAISIISLRLKSNPQKVDMEFWLDVLEELNISNSTNALESAHSFHKQATNGQPKLPEY